MTHRTNCPHCGRKLEADSEWGAVKVDCPSCGEKFDLPGGEEEASTPVALRRVERPAAQPPSTPSRSRQSYQPSGSGYTGTDGVAVASLICGILGLLFFPFALPAIICGHVAGAGANRRGRCHWQSGMATAGLVLGFLVMGGVVLVFALSQAREKARPISCAANMKQIGMTLSIYASDFDGNYPPGDGAEGLRVLIETKYIMDPNVFVCPSTGTPSATSVDTFSEETLDYEYRGGLNDDDGETRKTPILWDRDGNHVNFGNILYGDGHVKGFSGPNWKDALRQ